MKSVVLIYRCIECVAGHNLKKNKLSLRKNSDSTDLVSAFRRNGRKITHQ